MPDRRFGRWLLGVVWGLVVAGGGAATVLLVDETGTPLRRVVTGAAALALAGLISVPASGRSAFTPASVVAACLPLISDPNAGPMFDRPAQFAVVSAGLTVLALARALRGDDRGRVVVTTIRRAASFAAYLAVFDAVRRIGGIEPQWAPFVWFAVAAVAGFAVEVVLGGLFRSESPVVRRRYLARLTFHDLDVYLSLTATGALFGLAFAAIGWWAVAVAALPYLFTHGAFRRLEAARQTYAQTVRALARIPEAGGHSDPGHSARTAELAAEVAASMGLGPSEVEEIELSALMHDIGRVTLNEPGILRMGYTEVDLARWGAEIVGETAHLAGVAEIIRRTPEPYRNPGEQRDPDVPLAARIVKVCSAYDEATSTMGFSPLEAMERLHRGSVYDYDPDAVNALRGVLERRGVFVRVPAR